MVEVPSWLTLQHLTSQTSKADHGLPRKVGGSTAGPLQVVRPAQPGQPGGRGFPCREVWWGGSQILLYPQPSPCLGHPLFSGGFWLLVSLLVSCRTNWKEGSQMEGPWSWAKNTQVSNHAPAVYWIPMC